MKKKVYRVIVGIFSAPASRNGPFSDRATAEAFAIACASRSDLFGSITIHEEEIYEEEEDE